MKCASSLRPYTNSQAKRSPLVKDNKKLAKLSENTTETLEEMILLLANIIKQNEGRPERPTTHLEGLLAQLRNHSQTVDTIYERVKAGAEMDERYFEVFDYIRESCDGIYHELVTGITVI